jgi:hypothetical protein
LIHKRGQSAITLLKLADQSLAGASFTSVAELRTHIDAFVDTYNEQAKPFALYQIRSLPETPQSTFRGPMILGTSVAPRIRPFIVASLDQLFARTSYRSSDGMGKTVGTTGYAMSVRCASLTEAG